MRIGLDFGKLSQAKKRSYTRKDGSFVETLDLDIVQLKEPKVVHSTDKYDKVKTHFVSLPKVDKNEPTVYVGEGFTMEWKNSGVSAGWGGNQSTDYSTGNGTSKNTPVPKPQPQQGEFNPNPPNEELPF